MAKLHQCYPQGEDVWCEGVWDCEEGGSVEVRVFGSEAGMFIWLVLK